MVLYCVSLGLSFCFVVVLLHAITQCSDMLWCIARAIVLCLLASAHEFVFAAIHIWVCVFAAVYAAQPSVCALLYDSTLGASTNTRHYLSFWPQVAYYTITTTIMVIVITTIIIVIVIIWQKHSFCRLTTAALRGPARIRSSPLIGNLRIFHKLPTYKWLRNAKHDKIRRNSLNCLRPVLWLRNGGILS